MASITLQSSNPNRQDIAEVSVPRSQRRDGLSPASAAEPGILLQARSIAKAFNGVPALLNGRIDLRSGSIHALCGGNGAGKSTFLNIVTGILRKDSGSLVFKGEEVDFSSPIHSLKAGISIITQELSPVPDMTVAENLFLGHQPNRFGFVDWKSLYRRAGELLEKLEFKINPRAKVRELPLAQIQLVEIAKALNHEDEVSVLIMDEPTSALGEHEVETLFRSVRRLADLGTGIIYVSHRMTEIFSLCDDYTVFRDGAFVEAGRVADTNRKQLVSKIIGRDYQDQFPESKSLIEDKPLVRAEGISLPGKLRNVSTTVKRGEILGIYGLAGSGRTELLNVLYGLEKPEAGTVHLEGEKVSVRSPREAITHGIALVPEDRKQTGLVLTSSVRDNISLSSLGKLSSWGFLRRRVERERVKTWMKELRIKAASSRLAVHHMSGGNQQKVVLARALETGPRLLLLDEPTRGVDAGAKQEIYQFIRDYVSGGNGVITVSSEVEEVLGISSRILVLRRGKVTADLPNNGLTAADLLHAAS